MANKKYPLTAAVLGSGKMGKSHLWALSNHVENVVLCSLDEAEGKALAEQYGCRFYLSDDEMYANEKLDLVSICLPTHLHCSATKKAIAHGAAVLCEKPFASSDTEAAEMLAASKEAGVPLMIAHLLRFAKPYEYLRRIIADQRFGKLLSLEMRRHGEMPRWSVGGWMADLTRSGGAVRDLHIHDTDIIVGYLGLPKEVQTFGTLTTCRTMFHYENGMSVSAAASWRNVKDFPYECCYDAVFEKATVLMNLQGVTVYTENGAFEPLPNEEFSEFFQSGSQVECEVMYFCHCLTEGIEPTLCSPEDSLKTMTVSSRQIESLAAGKPLPL